MKIVFAGTPEIAVTPLKTLLALGHDVVAVYTQPDQPAGRGRVLTASPVKQFALAHSLSLEQPENIKTEAAREKLRAYQADLMLVMAYGMILPQRILDTPRLGCMNIHVSLLPRWRGAAPVQHAILAGDQETGVTLMQMNAGLDTGNIVKQLRCPMLDTDTTESVYKRLEALIPDLLNDLSLACAIPQETSTATYAPKINKIDAKLDWIEPAEQLVRKIRAYNPAPVAYAGDVRIWMAHSVASNSTAPPGTITEANKQGITVQTGKGAVCVTELQLPGKKRLPASALLNAHQHRFTVGCLFDGA